MGRKVDGIVELAFRRRAGGPIRLGLVVSSRMLPRAVDRNRFRRIVRESFRVKRLSMPGGDVLVRLRRPVKDMDDWPREVAQSVERLLTMVSRLKPFC